MPILKALGSQWLATVYVGAVSLALVFLLARLMGPEAFGKYNYLLTLAALLAILQDGGFKTLLLRERVSSSPALARLAPDLLRLAGGHVVVATVFLLLAIAVLPLEYRSELMLAVACYGLIVATQFVSSTMKGAGDFVRESAWQFAWRTPSAILILAAVLLASPAPGWVFAAWGMGLILALRFFPGRLLERPAFRFESEIYRSAVAFLVIDLATTVYFRIDIVMLHNLTGNDAEVGYYSAAYRLLEAVILLVAPAATIFFRELRLRWQDLAVVRSGIGRALAVMTVLASLIVGLTYLIGPWLIQLAYGDGYRSSYPLLIWIMLSLFFILPNYVLTQGAIALNRERFYALAACLAAGVNIGLNWLLIPSHGALGAAWATLATEAVLGLILSVGMWRWLRAGA